MKNWLFLIIAIIAEVIATSALKTSDGFSKLLPSVVVVMGYGVAFYFLSLTLRTIPMGIVYALWSGVGIVLISGIGWVWHGEKLSLTAMAGIAFVVFGVVLLNVSSKSGAH